MEENKVIYNDYDENDREVKRQYLKQLTAITRFIEGKVDREMLYRKEKVSKLRAQLNDFWRNTNVCGYDDENSDMPRAKGGNNSSVVERVVFDKIKLEDRIKKLQGKDEYDPKNPEEIDRDDVYAWVFTRIEQEHPIYPVVYNEILNVIHGLSNAKAVLIMEDRYLMGYEVKQLEIDYHLGNSSINALMNNALDEIRIPEVQRTRRWIEW